MMTKISEINKISERKKLIAEIQDLFNKANILETPFNNDDDLSKLIIWNFYMIIQSII